MVVSPFNRVLLLLCKQCWRLETNFFVWDAKFCNLNQPHFLGVQIAATLVVNLQNSSKTFHEDVQMNCLCIFYSKLAEDLLKQLNIILNRLGCPIFKIDDTSISWSVLDNKFGHDCCKGETNLVIALASQRFPELVELIFCNHCGQVLNHFCRTT